MTYSQPSNSKRSSAGNPPSEPSGVSKASVAKPAAGKSAETNEIEDSLTSIINLAKKDEGEAFGLTEGDMRNILVIISKMKSWDKSLTNLVPSLDIALPSGLRGKLIWKKNTGYVFSFDSLSVFNL